MTDREYMLIALNEAQMARGENEVPVGAVLVKDGEILARAHNTMEREHDATRHAELVAMQAGMARLMDWRLTGCTLYVTLEPCAMCMGAAVNAHLTRIVFGALDPARGCSVSAASLDRGLGYDVLTVGGMLKEECSALLTSYFREKR